MELTPEARAKLDAIYGQAPQAETVLTPEARAKLDAIYGQQPQEQPPVEQGQPSIPEQLGRQVGLTARYGIEGLASPATFIGDVANIGINKLTGSNLQMPSELLSRGLTSIGLPSPSTPTERVVGDVSRALTGTGGMIKAGQSLAGIAPAVGKFLSAAPTEQMLSMAGGSAAGGITRESGGTPTQQLLASIAGGLGGAMSPAAVSSIKSISMRKPLSPASKIQNMRQQTEAIGEKRGALYSASDAENIKFTPNESGQLFSKLKSLEPKDDLSKRTWKSSGASKHVEEITNSIITENPNLNGLLTKRSDINSDINVAVRAGNESEARKLMQVKDKLDDVMKSNKTKTWQEANHLYSQESTLQDIDNILFRVEGMNQPANSFDTAFKKWIGNNKRYLSDEEFKVAMDVVNNSTLDKLKKGMASGLLKYATTAVGSTGGPIGSMGGYLVGHFGSEFAKDSAMLVKLSKLEKFRDKILSRQIKTGKPQEKILQIADRGEAARAAERQAIRMDKINAGKTGGLSLEKPQSGVMVGTEYGDVPYNYYSPSAEAGQLPPLMLPPPQKEMIASNFRGIRPQSNIEQETAQIARQRAEELGLSSDIRNIISKDRIRKELGPIWDNLENKERKLIQAQIEFEFKKNKRPLEDIIQEVAANLEDVQSFTGGSKTAIQEAMLARIKAGKNVSQREIMNLPPKDAKTMMDIIKSKAKDYIKNESGSVGKEITLTNIKNDINKDNIKIDLFENKGLIYLSKIIVPKEKRNLGLGTKHMNKIIDYADDSGKTITLSPSSDFGGNKNKLINFYKRFGFVENKGKNRDFEISDSMYRKPSPSKSKPDFSKPSTQLSLAGITGAGTLATKDRNK